jgi:hypothetical protein
VEPEIVEKIKKNIHRRFPEVHGVKPKVRKQPIPKSAQGKVIQKNKRNYLLTFKKEIRGPLGKKIPRWVRVVATPKGKIIKITTSK